VTGIRVLALGGLLLAGSPGALVAQEASVRPGINEHYRSPDYGYWVGVFESPGREVYARRAEVVAALDLRPGMTVADIGAGTGFYTRLIADAVGSEGRVYAVDIAQSFVDEIVRTATEQGLTNVQGVVNNPRSAMLPRDSLDLAFVCDTYHHFEYPKSMLRSIREALKEGGDLVVIDFRKIPGFSSGWVMGHVRADRPRVIKEIEAEGFRLVEQPDILHSNYFLRFRKQ